MRLLLIVICCIICPGSLRAQSPDIAAYLGAFADGPGSYITISLLRAGTRPMLMLSVTRTEQLRILFAHGRDRFTVGPALVATEPIEAELRFRRRGDDVVAVEIHTPGVTVPRVYSRIQLRSQPFDIRNGETHLRGTLHLPASSRQKLPAIVLVHGSEESDRHSFGPLPLTLAAHGYAVLAYDKRGTGQSSGSWRDVGLEPLAEDVSVAIAAIASHSEIDAARIALVGTSEGAWVAALASRLNNKVKAIVAISGGARTKREAYVYKMRRVAEEAGLTGARLDSAIAAAELTVREAVDRVHQGAASGFDKRMAYDPTADWSAFTGAFLYMGGGMDVLEPAPESAVWFEQTFQRSGNRDYTIKVLPKAHHSLILAVHGTPAEFNNMQGLRQLAPGYWDILLRWLDARFRK